MDSNCLPQHFIPAHPLHLDCVQEINWEMKLCPTGSLSSGLRLPICGAQLSHLSTGRERLARWPACYFSFPSHASGDPEDSLPKPMHSCTGCNLALEPSGLASEPRRKLAEFKNTQLVWRCPAYLSSHSWALLSPEKICRARTWSPD